MKPHGELVVLGLALVAITPAAPRFLRKPDIAAIHLFRPLDAAASALYRRVAEPPVEDATARRLERLEEGLGRWNDVLRAGADRFAPDRAAIVARIIAIDGTRRRLLVDLGRDVAAAPGDPVIAGNVAVGVVERCEAGCAVVVTPWTPEARFAAACLLEAEEREVRFVLVGLDRRAWTASVVHPERQTGLAAGVPVIVPAVDDLLPSSVPRLPPGLRVGELRVDEMLAATGTDTFRAVPVLDVRSLDAVVVLPTPSATPVTRTGFLRREVVRLSCGSASAARDAAFLAGSGLPDGAAVTCDGWFAGVIEGSVAGAARVRGVFDPGQETTFLVLGEGRTWPIAVQTTRVLSRGGRMRVLEDGVAPAAGDLIVTAGRGVHVPRGLIVGQVSTVDGVEFELTCEGRNAGARVEALQRKGLPADPWGGA